MISTAYIFEIQTAYRSCLDNNNNKMNFWNIESISLNNLTNMSKKLHQKYHNFFNTQNADWLASHQITDHAIDFKSDIKLSYMHMYNMFSTKLKTLNNYFNNALVKKWICEFQNFIDAFILFIFWKSKELHFCVDYHELNIIIIKNHYSLLLTSELLNWLSSSTVFLKINLWNAYHRIHIYQDDKWKTAFHTWYRYLSIKLFHLI